MLGNMESLIGLWTAFTKSDGVAECNKTGVAVKGNKVYGFVIRDGVRYRAEIEASPYVERSNAKSKKAAETPAA